MFISVLVLSTPFLLITVSPLPAQTFTPTTQHYIPALHTQSKFTKYTRHPSTMTQHQSTALPPTNTGAPTHPKTLSTPVSESITLETTIEPVPETTILPFSETTASTFQETESGPQIKTSTVETHHTTGHISTVPAPITSIPQHFKTSDSSTSRPQHFKTPDSATSRPQHFKTPDSATSRPQHFKTPDSATSRPQHFNISDSPNSYDSLDKKSQTTDVFAFTKIYPSSVDTTTATSTVNQTQSIGPSVINLDSTPKQSNESGHLEGRRPNWLWVIVIILIGISMGGVFAIVCVKRRKKKRSRNFRTSFQNGGSYSKKKKNLENNAWAGPMPTSEEKEMEVGGEEEEEVGEKSKGGDEEQMVLSTFTTIQEGKAEELGGDLGNDEAESKAEVPLLQSTKDGKENDPPTVSLSSSLLPPLDDDRESEQDGGQAFCLTTAV